MEERPIPHDDDPPMILTITHEQAVALAAAAIHFQGWCARHDEAMAAASSCLEEITHTILTHPHLAPVSHATLEDMQWQNTAQGKRRARGRRPACPRSTS